MTAANIQTITVEALNRYVKAALESDENLRLVRVIGEISNFSRNTSSGHLYFNLRDDRASISAAMFRGDASRLKFYPENGTQVIVTGRVSLYEKGGTYQIIVSAMEPAGLGEQQRRLRELTEKLKAEGLFDESRKRPLPAFPSSIAVITSRDTAALQDIIKVISRRWPAVRLIVCHTSVQEIGRATS